MTPDTVQDYIVDELGMTPRHNIMSLTQAISDIAEEQDLPHEEVMKLLLANEPTSNGTVSYTHLTLPTILLV